MNSDNSQQRQKVYKYNRNGTIQVVKREWVNKGDNSFKKEVMKAYFESRYFDITKHTVKFYYDEYIKLNNDFCPVSFSMFYKYFINEFVNTNYKERPNLRISAKIKDEVN